MRRAAKVDGNHGQIVDALRKVGAWVWSTAGIGNGFPDLLVWYGGRFTLLEVKDFRQPPSKRALTEAERQFLDACPGDAFVVTCVGDALRAIGAKVR